MGCQVPPGGLSDVGYSGAMLEGYNYEEKSNAPDNRYAPNRKGSVCKEASMSF
jgi:hypothetical protein